MIYDGILNSLYWMYLFSLEELNEIKKSVWWPQLDSRWKVSPLEIRFVSCEIPRNTWARPFLTFS